MLSTRQPRRADAEPREKVRFLAAHRRRTVRKRRICMVLARRAASLRRTVLSVPRGGASDGAHGHGQATRGSRPSWDTGHRPSEGRAPPRDDGHGPSERLALRRHRRQTARIAAVSCALGSVASKPSKWGIAGKEGSAATQPIADYRLSCSRIRSGWNSDPFALHPRPPRWPPPSPRWPRPPRDSRRPPAPRRASAAPAPGSAGSHDQRPSREPPRPRPRAGTASSVRTWRPGGGSRGPHPCDATARALARARR